jgi:hypothetical protein
MISEGSTLTVICKFIICHISYSICLDVYLLLRLVCKFSYFTLWFRYLVFINQKYGVLLNTGNRLHATCSISAHENTADACT